MGIRFFYHEGILDFFIMMGIGFFSNFQWILESIYCFFCIYWDDNAHVYIVDIDYTDWFSNVEPGLAAY
jgi:hypothetical protein